MRAIIRCDTDLPKGQLFKVIDGLKLLPTFDQDDTEVLKHKEEILGLVAPEDLEMVKRTYWFMVYHHTTRSWGLVNSPVSGTVEFRVRNKESAKLKQACEKLVHALLSYANPGKVSEKNVRISFPESILVLEAGSQHLSFEGDALSLDLFKQAREERKSEWQVGRIATIAGFLLAFLTIPTIQSILKNLTDPEWLKWFIELIGRLATSAFTTAAVALFNVYLHFFELKRQGSIRWRLK